MSLLTNILYPVTEPIADFYQKIKDAITTINLLGGGTAGQVLTKTSSGDFAFIWSDPAPNAIEWLEPIPIGAWNMTTTGGVLVAHGVADFTKIKAYHVIIFNDDASLAFDFLSRASAIQPSGDPMGISGYIAGVNATAVSLERVPVTADGVFFGSDFDDGVINRGYLTIGVSA